MIRALITLILLAATATGLAWLMDLRGGLLVNLGPYQLETSLAVAAVGTLALAVVLAVIWASIRFVINIPHAVSHYYSGRKRDKGYQAVARGMMAIGMGDRKTAERAARDAHKFLGAEPLVLLLQAQSAQLSGDKLAADLAFRTMLDNEDARTLGLRGLFIEAQRRGDPDEALSFARQAQQDQPALAWANEALLEWHCQQQDWSQALALLQRQQKQMDKPLYRRQRAVLLTAYATSLHKTDAETAFDLGHEAVKLAPDLVPATVLVAQLLISREDFRKASRLLEACWALAPHPDLAHAYIHLRHGDSPVDRLTRAEVLTRQNADLPDSRYALANCALDARDFTRARQLLAPVIANRPTTRFCLLMARLEQLEHHDPSAAKIWLARASRAPRDAAWIADGLVSDHWAAVSPVTGRLDAFLWMYPQESISYTDQPNGDAAGSAPIRLPPAPVAARVVQDSKRPMQKTATSVVFPLVTSPDDPGPMDASGDDEGSQTGKPAKPVHLFGG